MIKYIKKEFNSEKVFNNPTGIYSYLQAYNEKCLFLSTHNNLINPEEGNNYYILNNREIRISKVKNKYKYIVRVNTEKEIVINNKRNLKHYLLAIINND